MEESKDIVTVNTPATVWLTGLSGAGKSTIAEATKERLDALLGRQDKVFILDGDVVRQGLNKDLGFSADDRAENIRRISEVSRLFTLSGQLVLSAFISPYTKDREFARECHKDSRFIEAYVSTSLECCEERDVKGLYKKARQGIIPNFTGVSDPYEAPTAAEIDLNTEGKTIDESVDELIRYLVKQGILSENANQKEGFRPGVSRAAILPSIIEETEELFK